MNIFMQIFRVRTRLSILPRVLSEGEKEKGHLQLKKKKGHWGYCSMLNGWRISMYLLGFLCLCHSPGINIFAVQVICYLKLIFKTAPCDGA